MAHVSCHCCRGFFLKKLFALLLQQPVKDRVEDIGTFHTAIESLQVLPIELLNVLMTMIDGDDSHFLARISRREVATILVGSVVGK